MSSKNLDPGISRCSVNDQETKRKNRMRIPQQHELGMDANPRVQQKFTGPMSWGFSPPLVAAAPLIDQPPSTTIICGVQSFLGSEHCLERVVQPVCFEGSGSVAGWFETETPFDARNFTCTFW